MSKNSIIANNKKAKHDYSFIESYEAGIVLTGTEIKSIRENKVSIKESFVLIQNGEAWVHNMYVGLYSQGNIHNHIENRKRKLLLHKKEIKKIGDLIKLQNLSVIPYKVYLLRGKAKVEIVLAKGRNNYDKRQAEKNKSEGRKLREGDYT